MKRRNFNLGWFGLGPLGGLGLAGLLVIGALSGEWRAGGLDWLAAERRVRGAAERRVR